MRLFPLLALAGPLLLLVWSPARAAPLPGGYAAADPKSELAGQAKARIQNYFLPLKMRLGEPTEASVQVVAGTNVKLRCWVTGDRDPALWEFVIWHRLDGTWRLTRATHLGFPLPAGDYAPLDKGSAPATLARTSIESLFTTAVTDLTDAAIQGRAGSDVFVLIHGQMKGDNEPALWEFVTRQSAAGGCQLISATKLRPLI